MPTGFLPAFRRFISSASRAASRLARSIASITEGVGVGLGFGFAVGFGLAGFILLVPLRSGLTTDGSAVYLPALGVALDLTALGFLIAVLTREKPRDRFSSPT